MKYWNVISLFLSCLAIISTFTAFFCPHLNKLEISHPADQSFYCLYCKRRLIVVHEDKKFDLAGMAGTVGYLNRMPPFPPGFEMTEKDMVITAGECFRPICKFKRWMDKGKTRT